MSVDLNALAHQIASELAKGDLARPTPGGRPPVRLDGQPTAPRGVTFAGERVRLAGFLEHTLLRLDAQRWDVERHCAEAAQHRFAAVCVAPLWVPLCRSQLAGTAVRIATVVGFPAGAVRADVKAAETRAAVDDGADEVDAVAAIGLIKGGEWRAVAADVAAVVRAAQGRLVKVVIEAATLTPTEIVRASAIVRDEGADYVKTSAAGAHPTAGGATAEAVALARLVCGDVLGVAAAGGVGDGARAFALIASGATRIGTSRGVGMADCLGAGPLPVASLFGAGASSAAVPTTAGQRGAPTPRPTTGPLTLAGRVTTPPPFTPP